MGVDGLAIMGLECDVVGLTGVGATTTRIRFARLSSSVTSTLDRFAALFCFGFGMDLNGRVVISAKSLSP